VPRGAEDLREAAAADDRVAALREPEREPRRGGGDKDLQWGRISVRSAQGGL